jgi:integrase
VATIRKREGKKGVGWQAIVRRGDHPPQRKTFHKKSDAEAWATALESKINADEYVPSPEARRRTVREMLERYRRTELPKKSDRRNYERHIDFWINEIGSYRLAAVTRAQIVEIRDRMAESRAPATVNRYLATLRHCFRIAATDWEWVGKSPCERIMLREPNGRDRHLDDDEIAELLKATKSSPHPQLHAMVLIGLTTGARRGEITGLRWGDIDLAKGRAILHKTKNTNKRTLALSPQVIAELREIRKVRRLDTDLIFANPNPQGRRIYSNIEAAWQSALSEAGITNFRFHDLRHTFASRMAMDGRTLNEIAGALGHKTLAMVQRYAHLTEGHVHDAMLDTAKGILGDR